MSLKYGCDHVTEMSRFASQRLQASRADSKGIRIPAPRNARTLACLLLFLTFAVASLSGQTFQILHTFTLGEDGGIPHAGLAIDRSGNLYGTASAGGNMNGTCAGNGCGVVFKFAQKNSNWVLTPLYAFQGGADGASPMAPVIIGPDGSLYGTTSGGGGTGCYGYGCGTVFNLRPAPHASANALGSWQETVLHSFPGNGFSDGAIPGGTLLMDAAGNIYGSTSQGGPYNKGVVYELAHSNGAWSERILYSFTGASDGAFPSGVMMDAAGNLYGEAGSGGLYGGGTVFQLSLSGSEWVETTLHSFTGQGDGRTPSGGLISDQSGNFFGTTSEPGTLDTSGTVFELSPHDGQWSFATIYQFQGEPPSCAAGPSFDSAGNLWGTNVVGNGPDGEIWELQAGYWYHLYSFYFYGDYGGAPYSTVTFDANGNAFGTTTISNPWPPYGEVWEITR